MLGANKENIRFEWGNEQKSAQNHPYFSAAKKWGKKIVAEKKFNDVVFNIM